MSSETFVPAVISHARDEILDAVAHILQTNPAMTNAAIKSRMTSWRMSHRQKVLRGEYRGFSFTNATIVAQACGLRVVIGCFRGPVPMETVALQPLASGAGAAGKKSDHDEDSDAGERVAA